MPEAPEVQNVIDTLQQELQDVGIVSVSITHPKLSENIPYEQMEEKLAGQHLRAFSRHGKYLILQTDDYDWICHLRMEGKFLLEDQLPENEKIRKHIHAVFTLDDGRLLCYRDTRKFGRMQLYDKAEHPLDLPCFQQAGRDVLDPQADGAYLYEKIHRRSIAIKSALLDQHVIAGIGNIYADEILFAAKIDPRSSCSHLSLQDCQTIMNECCSIMERAIAGKGTTIRSFSFGHGNQGSFQNQLMVHTRKGQPCRECGEEIIMVRVGQRSTYLCPNCQKLR